MKKYISVILFLLISQVVMTQDDMSYSDIKKYYTEVAFTFSHFEQQVKSKIGGQKGDLIVDETNLSFYSSAGIKLFPALSLGAYFCFDTGKRNNSLFDGFDTNGQATTKQTLGGNYSEVWVGPFIKVHYKQLFLSLGYGLIGTRNDDGRTDLTGSNGNLDDFSLDPSVAWVFNIGGQVPINGKLSAYFGIEYRARYYNQRGGVSLQDNVVFGTQNFTPLFGVHFDL